MGRFSCVGGGDVGVQYQECAKCCSSKHQDHLWTYELALSRSSPCSTSLLRLLSSSFQLFSFSLNDPKTINTPLTPSLQCNICWFHIETGNMLHIRLKATAVLQSSRLSITCTFPSWTSNLHSSKSSNWKSLHFLSAWTCMWLGVVVVMWRIRATGRPWPHTSARASGGWMSQRRDGSERYKNLTKWPRHHAGFRI